MLSWLGRCIFHFGPFPAKSNNTRDVQADHHVTVQCSARKGPGPSYGLLCDPHKHCLCKICKKTVATLKLVQHKHHNWLAWQYCAGSRRTMRLSYFIVEVLSSQVLHLLIISTENNAYPQLHLTTNLSPGNLSYTSLDCWRKLEHSEGTRVKTQIFLT